MQGGHHHICMNNGAKLGVAPVARAPPLFLPRPELNYLHICAPHFCPAPNLFSTCNTAFEPRLAPLCMNYVLVPPCQIHSCIYYSHFQD